MRTTQKTPIRSFLNKASSLHEKIHDGIRAMENAHRGCLGMDIRPSFADSLDLDKAVRSGREEEHRWDYLLGHAPSSKVVGLEHHSAKQDEITVIIRKMQAAKVHLAEHLKPSAKVAAWLWVASGSVRFADTERARRRLDQHGIVFVGGKVLPRHLPAAQPGRKEGKVSDR